MTYLPSARPCYLPIVLWTEDQSVNRWTFGDIQDPKYSSDKEEQAVTVSHMDLRARVEVPCRWGKDSEVGDPREQQPAGQVTFLSGWPTGWNHSSLSTSPC